MTQENLSALLDEIRSCRICESHLPLGPNPIVEAGYSATIAIIGQAPGTRVHKTGIPWNDPSGDTLRIWMDVDKETFYNNSKFAITPMGFCYPGKGPSGDLPPRPECASTWHQRLFDELPALKLVLLIGQYAQSYYLGRTRKKNLTETVKSYQDYLPRYFVLPHPSPRNRIWLKRNPWFEEVVIPDLRSHIQKNAHG